MQFLKYIKYGIICGVLGIAASCSKMDATYEEFIKDGPIVYPGRVDSLLALAGQERIELKWAVPSDLNITRYVICWNFGADSLAVPGRKPSGSDSVEVLIDLPEGSYGFTVYSYDTTGHRSVGTEAIGNVYGDNFSAIIFNRGIRALHVDTAAGSIAIAWVGLDTKCIGTEWRYTGIDQEPKTFFSPLGDSTYLYDVDVINPVSYRSLFMPESNAIDTFYTEFITL